MPSQREQGFTLIETLVAMLILTFGLLAVANLFFLAQSANKVASHQTAAVALATDVLERLKAIPYAALTPGGAPSINGGVNIASPIDMAPGLATTCNDDPGTAASSCVRPGTFNLARTIPGVGVFHVRWQVIAVSPGVGGGGAMGPYAFIRVAADTRARLLGGRALVEMSAWRILS